MTKTTAKNIKTYIQKETSFSAAHRYHQAAWTDTQNKSTFGPCNQPHGHGHDYRLVVEIEVAPSDTTSADTLKAALKALHKQMDHQHLNYVIPEFRDSKKVPTTENLTLYCLTQIQKQAPALKIHRVQLFERHNLWTEIKP